MTYVFGTSNFYSMAHAIQYYKRQGYTRMDVVRKLENREIHLGPPSVRPGQKLTMNKEGRYEVIC